LHSLLSLLISQENVWAQQSNQIQEYKQNLLSADDSVRFASLKELHYLYTNRDMDTARFFLNQLRALAENSGNIEYIATSLGLEGRWSSFNYETDSAFYYYRVIKRDEN
ncbi:MAG: hypothetical protein AAFY41_10955, partial [Bacteroidota bacterium]